MKNEDDECFTIYAEHKDRMEADNQNLVLTFGSDLDKSLKELHKVILGSISQQTQQIRSIEEQVRTNFASKYDVTQDPIDM